MRARSVVPARKKHKKMLKKVKGYSHNRRSSYRKAKEAWIKAQTYAYRDRRNKKRDFRQLWITRISAACRLNDISYSKFMNNLKVNEVTINRKMLSEIAITNPESFTSLVEKTKT